LKPPIRSWVSASVILLLLVSLFFYGPSKKGTNNFFDFIDANFHWGNGKWLPDSSLVPKGFTDYQYYGTAEHSNVSLKFLNSNLSKSNIHITSKAINTIFGIKGVSSVKLNSFSDYDVETMPNTDTEVILNQNIRDINLETNIGSFSGEIKNELESFEAHSETGILAFSFFKSAKEIQMDTNIGNIVVNLYKPAELLVLNSNVGNIEIHVAKGLRVDMTISKTNIGKITNSNTGDGSQGTIQLEAKTDIGNIIVVADL
jgi:hypothetical protein